MKSIIKFLIYSYLALLSFSFLSGCLMGGTEKEIERAQYVAHDDPDTAIYKYRQIIARHPESPQTLEAHYRLGKLLLLEENSDQARQEFELAVELDESSIWGRGSLIEIIELENPEPQDAETLLLAISQENLPPDILDRLNFYLGDVYFTLERWNESLKSYRKSVTIRNEPGMHYTYLLKTGICEWRTGQLAHAEQSLSRALSLNPDSDYHIYQALAELHLTAARPDQALGYLYRGLTLDQDHQIRLRLQEVLASRLDDPALLIQMRENREGEAGFLVHFEKVRRDMTLGELEKALDHLRWMNNNFPLYRKSIMSIAEDVKARMDIITNRIGLLVPLSGNISSIGHSIFQGATLAVEDHRTQFPDIPVELVLRDTAGNPETAVSGYRELAEMEKVYAVVGPVRSESVEAIAGIASEYYLCTLTPGCPKSGIVSTSPYLFRLFPSPEREAYILARYLITTFEFQNFACIYPDIAYGKSALAGLEKALEEFNGAMVTARKYRPDTLTFRTLLGGMDEMDMEMILIPDEAERAAQVAGQIRYQEILEPFIIGTGGWEDQQLTTISGPHLENGYLAAEYPQLTGPRLKIVNRFKSRFGETPDSFAIRAYEAVFSILKAIRDGNRYREQLHVFLSNDSGFSGLGGISRFNEVGDYEPPVLIYAIQGGELIPWCLWENDQFVTGDALESSIDGEDVAPASTSEDSGVPGVTSGDGV